MKEYNKIATVKKEKEEQISKREIEMKAKLEESERRKNALEASKREQLEERKAGNSLRKQNQELNLQQLFSITFLFYF